MTLVTHKAGLHMHSLNRQLSVSALTRYAFREYMTDVVVQNMVTEQRTRIKCRAYVKKISVYKDRLAVQLPDRLYIYELSSDEVSEMRSQPLER